MELKEGNAARHMLFPQLAMVRVVWQISSITLKRYAWYYWRVEHSLKETREAATYIKYLIKQLAHNSQGRESAPQPNHKDYDSS